VAHRVVDQQFTDEVVDADVCPAGAGHLAQVMTGPLALPQSGEHGTRLTFTERLAVA
jgi:hypothetical protein